MDNPYSSSFHGFHEEDGPVPYAGTNTVVEHMPIFPMEHIRCVLDVETQLIAVVLERTGVKMSPAVTMDATGVIRLIQALRMSLKDLEMQPPIERCPPPPPSSSSSSRS